MLRWCDSLDVDDSEAVRLARLEVQVQTDHWGSVEWAHDIELHDTTARTAAAVMFVQCSSASSNTRQKYPQI